MRKNMKPGNVWIAGYVIALTFLSACQDSPASGATQDDSRIATNRGGSYAWHYTDGLDITGADSPLRRSSGLYSETVETKWGTVTYNLDLQFKDAAGQPVSGYAAAD